MDPAPNTQPLRAFPTDQYYSLRTLPAAHPGDYSGFTQAVRRVSQGAQSMVRPSSEQGSFTPNYQSVRQMQEQKKQTQSGAPPVPMMVSSTSNGSRPSSSSHSYQSPYAAPLTPATTHSGTSASKNAAGPSTDADYLANLQKYPYLLKSYCRMPKVYESPYTPSGGFSSPYAPAPQPNQDNGRPRASHTPQASVSSVGDTGKSANQQWTPPSQVWDQAGFANRQTPPPHHHAHQPPSRQLPIYSTPQEFQRQIQAMPSTASRDGAQARMLREQGYMPGYPYQRNSFGQSYDTARMWNSPKAPTPSPLSDPNTPGQTPNRWGTLPRAEIAPMMQPPSAGGYGPYLPQMQGGQDPWKFK